MKRLFFALMFAISVHAALLFIKINTSVKPESLLKSEPIKITMSYRQIKQKIKNNQPEIIKSDLKKAKKQVLIKKSIPPVNKKFKPVKKRQVAKTIKAPKALDKEVESEPDLKPAYLPLEQSKIINPEQASVPESLFEEDIENNTKKKDKSFSQDPGIVNFLNGRFCDDLFWGSCFKNCAFFLLSKKP